MSLAVADPAEGRNFRTWRADPDRYLRRVKGGRIQARPYDPETRERVNLGTFATREQARVARDRYWWGKAQPRAKFVRLARNQYSYDRGDPARYFVVLPTVSAESGRRVWRRVGGWFATEAEAAAAVLRLLTDSFGRIVAEAMLSRRDTSRRAGRY